jgi:hypothetical protein
MRRQAQHDYQKNRTHFKRRHPEPSRVTSPERGQRGLLKIPSLRGFIKELKDLRISNCKLLSQIYLTFFPTKAQPFISTKSNAFCLRDGMVDITDLKSVGFTPLPVQVRPQVPF